MEPLHHDDPRRLGPFNLVGRLGAGGMGRVYLGRDPGGRTVAVKTVRSDLLEDGDGFRRRFAREIAAARAVTGVFTARLVDADPNAATPWLATAYMPGVTLADAVAAHGPLPVRTVRHLARGLAVALEHIHAAGLVHRDVKPSNVLLTADGPRVIDFGIAHLAGATSLTRASQTLGSIAFMSPEQFETAEVGPASDVFSCGIVLAYASTAKLPFGEGPLPLLLANITLHEPDLDGVPEEFRSFVQACLTKRPQDRPLPRELVAELDNMVDTSDPSREAAWLPADVLHQVVRVATDVLGSDWAAQAAGGGSGDPDLGDSARVANPWLGLTPGDPPISAAPAPLSGVACDSVPPTPHGYPRIPSPPKPGMYYGHAAAPTSTRQPHEAPRPRDPEAAANPSSPTDSGGRPAGPSRRRSLYLGVGALAVGLPTAAFLRQRHNSKPSTPAGPPVLWSRDVGSPGRALGTPVVSGGRVFVSVAGKELAALDARTGRELWRVPTFDPALEEVPVPHMVPVVAKGLVHVVDANPRRTAVEQETGRIRWQIATSPSQSPGFGFDGGLLCSWNMTVPAEGAFFWTVEPTTGDIQWGLPLATRLSAPPTASGDVAYLVTNGGGLIAIDLAKHREMWRTEPQSSGGASRPFHGTVTSLGNSVCWMPAAGRIDAADPRTGALQWSATVAGRFDNLGAVVAADGTLFTSSADGFVTALAGASGAKRWLRELTGPLTTPAVDGRVVYVASTKGLTALDAAAGHVKWVVPEARGGSARICVKDRVVYVSDDVGALRAIAV
ncbi:PQQ-binding-like beta-propeller repeat protein (plasmid) [Embleya sp. NBC_00888]|uniref:serine/threonine-protein kinase n=1 Tax=Embleya sp. NBC_00888 TaxID=2975960 RepID=UPI002F910F0A|nr:PQQ-binding-like beta-propeller repeat protein [Embleya sp. NBC_00888]